MNGVQHKLVGVGFGIAGSYAIVHGYGEPLGICVLMGSAVGCMLPDIDHDMTKLGRQRKVLTNVSTKAADVIVFGGIIVGLVLLGSIALGFINYGIDLTKLGILVAGLILVAILRKVIGGSSTYKWATKHRGIMHTLVVPALLFLMMRVSSYPLWKYLSLGLMVGYCSHLFADMCTVEGCPVLWPLTRKNFRILKLHTKNKSCSVAAVIIFIGVIGLAVALF